MDSNNNSLLKLNKIISSDKTGTPELMLASSEFPSQESMRVDVSKEKKGTVFIVDYNAASPPRKGSDSRKKSKFSQNNLFKKEPSNLSDATAKSAYGTHPLGSFQTQMRSIFSKNLAQDLSSNANTPRNTSPSNASPTSKENKVRSRFAKVVSFSRWQRLLQRNLTSQKEKGTTNLRNIVQMELEERLRAQERERYDFGERITCMALSSDGSIVVLATHQIDAGRRDRFQSHEVGKAEHKNSNVDFMSERMVEDNPLLNIRSQETSINKVGDSFEKNRPEYNLLSIPDNHPMTPEKAKYPPALWLFNMETRIMEKLPLTEDYPDPENEITCVEITNDKKYAICGWNDKSIQIYDIQHKERAYNFRNAHDRGVTNIALSKDNQFFVSAASKDKSICVFSLSKRVLVYSLKNIYTDWIKCLLVSPDGKQIIIGFFDGTIKTIDRETKEVLKTFNIDGSEAGFKVQAPGLNSIGAMSLTTSGTYLVVGYQDKSIRIFNINEGNLVFMFDHAHEPISVTPDDRYIISASFDGAMRIFDFEKQEKIHEYDYAHSVEITSLLVSPQSKHLISGAVDGILQVTNLQKKEQLAAIEKVHTNGIDAMVLNRNHEYIITGSSDGSIIITDFKSYDFLHRIDNAHKLGIKALLLTNDDKYVISGSDDCSVKMFAMHTWSVKHDFETLHKDKVTALAITTNDKYLISGSTDRSITITNMSTYNVVHTYTNAHRSAVTCLAVTQNNQNIISGGQDRTIRVFSLNIRRLASLHVFEVAHQGPVRCLAVSYDNRYIVSGSIDKTVKIFHLEKRELIHTFDDAHTDFVNSILLSKDGKYIISGSNDRSICIFHLGRKKKIYTMQTNHKDSITSLNLTSDNNYIISASADSSVRIFLNPYNLTSLTVTESDIISPTSYFGLFILNHFLLESDSEIKYRMITKYQDLNIYPHALNLFHIVAVFFPRPDLIRFCLESGIHFSGDARGHTPLHYLLNSEKIDFNNINYLLENFDNLMLNTSESYKVMAEVTQDLPNILKLSPSLVVNLLKAAVDDPLSYQNQEIPHFGNIKGGSERRSVPYKSPIFTPEIKAELLDEEEGSQALSIRVVLLHMDYDLCSNELLHLLQALEKVDSEEIFQTKAISAFIDYVWEESKKHLYWITFFFTIYICILSIYAAVRRDEKELWMELVLLLFGFGFLLYEGVQAVSAGWKVYVADFWNLVDLLGNVMVIALVLSIWSNSQVLTKQWLMTLSLFLLYAKWISFFRIIDQTRRLIRTIIEILKDMRSFLALLLFAILGFSVIFFQFEEVDGNDYPQTLLLTYNLLYAQFDPTNYNNSQTFYLIIVTVLLSVVMLNMLVAIMSGTYNKVQESRILSDSKEKIILSLETVTFARMLKKAKNFLIAKKLFRKKSSIKHSLMNLFEEPEEKKGYLFFVEEATNETDEGEMDREMERRAKTLKKILKAEMQKQYGNIEQRIVGVESHVSRQENKLLSLKRSLCDRLNELENNVGQIVNALQQRKMK